MWSKCPHGYYQTPAQACPWCAGGDVSRYDQVTGPGNGWLLEKGDLTCKRCGGPRGAGYGAWAGPEDPTPEAVRAALEKIDHCYTCAHDMYIERKALAVYAAAACNLYDTLDMIQEDGDMYVLERLVEILKHPGPEQTNKELNRLLFVHIKRVLAEMYRGQT